MLALLTAAVVAGGGPPAAASAAGSGSSIGSDLQRLVSDLAVVARDEKRDAAPPRRILESVARLARGLEPNFDGAYPDCARGLAAAARVTRDHRHPTRLHRDVATARAHVGQCPPPVY